jgi:hypothetical protein
LFKQYLQREFNVGKAVPGRRKCYKFLIPQLIANAMALSNREVTAYDTNNYLMPSERRAYRSARSGSDRAEWDDAALTTANLIVVIFLTLSSDLRSVRSKTVTRIRCNFVARLNGHF